ncbi:TPA: type II toxin-antitoxin system antitoxin PemI [Escherichia coli]|nr:type II toxin-antitoxin system antitoxin PemI [Escherichia coli]HAZ3503328.1 type II toxin-antitoxin system antitoxin PemI [Escherichia coli]HAZ3652639.1 type II toxin-antitoxin system antitoxin PemI [Escherichia coli]HAZ3670772.1 type II toxin-antitoxin system antitoxin PemI [Escherichia coli]HBA8215729.1 type II toxin-antitoxin system antitoxin PemI [Escherichia coli]
MHTTRLKRVGGSVMLTVPPALLNALSLGTDNEVGMVIDNGRLIVEPHRRPQYSLAELLTQCDPNAEISAEEREWLDAPATGQEEI